MDPIPPPPRSRTFTWDNPHLLVDASKTMSGRAFLQAIQHGQLPPPPAAQMLGLVLQEVSDGRVVFALEPAEFHHNPLGVLHGGVLTMAYDSAMGCAVHSLLEAGVGYTTLDLTVRFIRTITMATGPIRCIGTVLSLGSRVAMAQAHLYDGQQTLLGHATSACALFRGSS